MLLYEILTGTTPFDAKTLLAAGLDAMRRTIREQEPARPSTRLATLAGAELTTTAKRHGCEAPKLIHLLAGDLDWIVMKCLEKDRSRRYETANGLATDLKRHLTNEPVVARPPSTVHRFQKALRRNRLAFAAASAIALALVVGVTVCVWQAVRANAARQAAEKAQLAEAGQRKLAENRQKEAESLRQCAEGSENDARRLLYAANMMSLQHAWEGNNTLRVKELLEETKDDPNRGFEWYYWQRQVHLPVRTFDRSEAGVMQGSTAFSHDARRLVSGRAGGVAAIWDTHTGRQLLAFNVHTNLNHPDMAFSPDGRRLLTCGVKHPVRVWDAVSGRGLFSLAEPFDTKGDTFAVYSPDGQRIATRTSSALALWNADDGSKLWMIENKAKGAAIRSLRFFPDGGHLLVSNGDSWTKVYDAATGKELPPLPGSSNYLGALVFSPDGRRILTTSGRREGEHTVTVWDAATGRELLVLKGHTAPVKSMDFSPDGRRIITGSGGAGFGIFLTRAVTEGETIVRHEETAYFLTSRRHIERQWKGLKRQWFEQWAWPVTADLQALWSDNPSDWRPINHSRDPNTWLDELEVPLTDSASRGTECVSMPHRSRLLLVLACLTALPALGDQSGVGGCAAAPGSWPQWRGPLANGVAPRANPPVRWSETNNIRWKIALPGKGHSSPVVFGNSVYVLSAAPVGDAQKPVYDDAPGVHDSVPVTHRHQFLALAISRRDGSVLWSKILREEWPHEGGHVTGSLASNSPVTDGERLYAFFGSRGLYCLDLNGEVKWQKDLGRMHTLHAHGEGSSPVLHGATLIVCWDDESESFLYAFNKHTGKILWKVSRDEKTSWSTPLIVEHEGKPQVIVSATKRVRGYELATGSQLWECAGLTDNVVSSPVYYDGLIIAGNSYYSQAMLAIRLAGAKGDITDTDHVAWKLNRLAPYVSSPLLYDDNLYVLRHNQNVLSRFDPTTGKPRGEPLRLEGINDFIFSSPIGAAGRIYVTGRDGTTVVLRHDRENAALAVNHLEDSFSASPAVVDREFYVRGEHYLYCIAEPAQRPSPAE